MAGRGLQSLHGKCTGADRDCTGDDRENIGVTRKYGLIFIRKVVFRTCSVYKNSAPVVLHLHQIFCLKRIDTKAYTSEKKFTAVQIGWILNSSNFYYYIYRYVDFSKSMSTKRYRKNTAFLESATEINQMKGTCSMVKNNKSTNTNKDE